MANICFVKWKKFLRIIITRNCHIISLRIIISNFILEIFFPLILACGYRFVCNDHQLDGCNNWIFFFLEKIFRQSERWWTKWCNVIIYKWERILLKWYYYCLNGYFFVLFLFVVYLIGCFEMLLLVIICCFW